MSCDFLVMSESRVKLYRQQTCRDSVEIKTLSSSAGNIIPASHVTSQSSHLCTGISYS